jgi:hypothetical protein
MQRDRSADDTGAENNRVRASHLCTSPWSLNAHATTEAGTSNRRR